MTTDLKDKLHKCASGTDSSAAQDRRIRAGKLSTSEALLILMLFKTPSTSSAVILKFDNKLRLITSGYVRFNS